MLPLDFVVTYAVSVHHEGYRHVSQFMSELGVPGTPFATVTSAWWVFYGCALVAASFALALELGRRPVTFPPTWALGLVGLLLGVGTGVFPCDPGCVAVSRAGQLHEVLGLAGSVVLLLAPLSSVRLLGPRVSALLLLVLAGLFGAQIAAGVGVETFAPLKGAIQRVFLAWGYVWVASVLMVALLNETPRDPATGS